MITIDNATSALLQTLPAPSAILLGKPRRLLDISQNAEGRVALKVEGGVFDVHTDQLPRFNSDGSSGQIQRSGLVELREACEGWLPCVSPSQAAMLKQAIAHIDRELPTSPELGIYTDIEVGGRTWTFEGAHRDKNGAFQVTGRRNDPWTYVVVTITDKDASAVRVDAKDQPLGETLVSAADLRSIAKALDGIKWSDSYRGAWLERTYGQVSAAATKVANLADTGTVDHMSRGKSPWPTYPHRPWISTAAPLVLGVQSPADIVLTAKLAAMGIQGTVRAIDDNRFALRLPSAEALKSARTLLNASDAVLAKVDGRELFMSAAVDRTIESWHADVVPFVATHFASVPGFIDASVADDNKIITVSYTGDNREQVLGALRADLPILFHDVDAPSEKTNMFSLPLRFVYVAPAAT